MDSFKIDQHFQVKYIERIYIANDVKPSINNEKILIKNSELGLHLTGGLLILYMLCAIGFITIPMLIFVLFHIREPTLPFLVPFIDHTTRNGSLITSTYHWLIVFTAVSGLGFCDALFSNLVFSMTTMSQLISNDLHHISTKLQNGIFNLNTVRVQLKNTYLMHSEVQRFVFEKILNE